MGALSPHFHHDEKKKKMVYSQVKHKISQSNLIWNYLATYTIHSRGKEHPHRFPNKRAADMSFQQHNPEVVRMQTQPIQICANLPACGNTYREVMARLPQANDVINVSISFTHLLPKSQPDFFLGTVESVIIESNRIPFRFSAEVRVSDRTQSNELNQQELVC